MDDFSSAEIEAGRRLFAGEWDFLSAASSLEFAAADGRAGNRFRRPLQCRQILADQCADRPQGAGAHLEYAGPHPGIDLLSAAPHRLMLVDMPGYGYAATAKSKVAAWTRLIHDYLHGRATLARVYVLIDARHGLKDADDAILDTLGKAAVSHEIVLTKCDQVGADGACRADRGGQGGDAETAGGLSRSDRDLVAHRRRHRAIARGDRAASRRAGPLDNACNRPVIVVRPSRG